MKDTLKSLGKFGCVGVFWVFVLSITVEGRPIFSYANQTLVQNSFVRMVDEDLGELWDKIYQTAKITFAEVKNEDDKG